MKGVGGASGERGPCESQVSVFLKSELLQSRVSSLASRSESQEKKKGEAASPFVWEKQNAAAASPPR